MEEEELRLLQKQDQNTFNSLILNYQDRVFNTLLGLVNHREDAEDLCQEVFVKAYYALPKFKGESKLQTWLYKLAINEGLMHLRRLKSKRMQHTVQQIDDRLQIPNDIHPGIAMENKENAKVLYAAINTLPENQIIAFRLRYFDDLKYDDIAEIMETSTAAVDSLLQRAKRNLKGKLENYYKNLF